MGRTNSAVVTMIAMELTQQTEGYAEYEIAMAAFDLVDPIYRKAVEYTRPLAAKWAEQNADKPLHQRHGSGSALWCRLRL